MYYTSFIRRLLLFGKGTVWLLIFLGIPGIVFSQQSTTVTGKVTDAETNEPLPGVSVFFKGTTDGTQTNEEGVYTLQNNGGNNALVFSLIGFAEQEVPIGSQTTIDVQLISGAENLDEVVVVGYGTQKKGNITSAVAKLDAKTFEERPISTIEQAFTGQIAGVQARSTNSAPGATLEVRVRGGASISAGNEPLYVVDGVVVPDLGSLNPNDISSIEVLKDAASSAIYGSRGSNGVVLVTTKRGITGKPRLQYNASFGMQQLEKKLDVSTGEEWIARRRQFIDSAWVQRGREMGLPYSASDPVSYRQEQLGVLQNVGLIPDPRWDYGRDSLAFIDWQEEFYQPAPVTQHQLSVSGGTDNFNYYVSGNYLNQDGIAYKTNFERFSFRANFEAKISSAITMGLNVSPSLSWTKGDNVSGQNAQAHMLMAVGPVAEKNVGTNTGAYGNPTYAFAGSMVSPIAYQNEALNNVERQRILSNVYLNAKLYEGLNLRVTGAWNSDVQDRKAYIPTAVQNRNATAAEGSLSSGRYETDRGARYTFESLLTYDKAFGNHNVSLLAGYTAERLTGRESAQRHSNFPNDLLDILDNATSTVNVSTTSEDQQTLIGYIGRVNYNYKEKYLLGASIRTDGSSKFGSSNRWGTFPALTAGWRVSGEEFMSSVDFINELKLRYSWGMNGSNNIPNYAAYGIMDNYGYSFGGALNVGYGPSTVANPYLGWEKARSSNFGIDLGLLKNRIFISADYYEKTTTDLLLRVPLALSTGFAEGWQNLGQVKNKGFEVEVTSNNLVGQFRWTSSVNMSNNSNRVLKLGTGDAPIYTGFQNQTAIITVGQPLMAHYMYDAIGVYMNEEDLANSPHMESNIVGDVKYRDVNGDGQITSADRTILGKRDPNFTWGFTNTFSYKNFDLSVLFQGQQGNKIYSILGRAIDRPGMGTTTNTLGRWRDAWKSEAEPGDGRTPRLDGTTGALYDSRWLYDASYIRLKNATLGYSVPEGKIRGINTARIFVSGENLLLIDDYYGGYSPEADNNAGGDYGGFPPARIFTLGLVVGF